MSQINATQSTSSWHPELTTLQAFAAGKLEDVELDMVATHILDCEECCSRIGSFAHRGPLESRLACMELPGAASDSSTQAPVAALRWLVCSRPPVHQADRGPNEMPQRVLQYRLLREVARGGMGIVFQAEDTTLRRTVAIKMILTGEFASSEMRLRFRREAEILARIQHPNIIQVYEVGEFRGLPFLAMEWIDGGNLASRIKAAPLEVSDACGIAKSLADAIHTSHLQGVIHRDLKPSNVLMSDRGPLITDFGIALRSDDDLRLTASGALSGTPQYTAPELWASQPALASTSTDVYALGVILYEMLSGYCPFRGTTGLETLLRAATEAEVPLTHYVRSLPRDVDVIVSKCLEKNPLRRYSSAMALADDLSAFLEGRPISARSSGPLERMCLWCSRFPLIASLLAALLVAITTGVFGSVWFALLSSRNEQEARHQAQRAIENAKVARAAQVRAEMAEEVALQRESDATSILLEMAWNDGDAMTFFRHVDNLLQISNAEELPFEQRVLLSRARAGHSKLPNFGSMVSAMCLTQDGETLLFAEIGGRLGTIDIDTGTLTREFEKNDCQLNHLTLAPDLSRAIGCDIHGYVLVWDLRSGKILLREKVHDDEVFGVEVLADGRIVTCSKDLTCRLLNSDLKHLRTFKSVHSFPTLAVSRDRSRIAVGTHDGAIDILDAATLESVSHLQIDGFACGRLQFSPDSRKLALASIDGLVCLLKAEPELEVLIRRKVTDRELVSLKWSSDSQRLVTGGHDNRVQIIDAESLNVLKTLIAHNGMISVIVCGVNDTQEIITASFDGTIRVWSDHRNPNPQRISAFNHGISQADLGLAVLSDRRPEVVLTEMKQIESLCKSHIHTFDITSDQNWMIAADLEARLFLINLRDMTVASEFQTQHGGIECVTFIGTEKMIVASGHDGAIRQWDTQKGTCLKELHGHKGDVRTMVFSEQSGNLISGGFDSRIIVWDVETSAQIGEFKGHQDKVFDLALTPQAELLSASEDGTVRLWNVMEGTEIMQFLGHVGPVRCVTTNPDGTRIVSGGWDQSVIVWNARTGQQVARWQDCDGEVLDVGFSADGDVLFSVQSNGELVQWHSRAD